MIHRILPLARRSAVPVPGSREEQLRAGSGCPELTNKRFVARLEAPVSRAASRLCRGELSRGTNLCFSSAVSEAWRDPRGVRVSPVSPAARLWRGQKQYYSAWRCAGCARCTSSTSYLLHSLHASPFPRAPCPFFIVLCVFTPT